MRKVIFFVFLMAPFVATSKTALADDLRVTTIAGTGAAGYQDGGALTTATFLFPSGIASDDEGNLYVIDTAAQRIRVISARGFVRTVAGSGGAAILGLWVVGGWRDGIASAAQFDSPTGITVRGNRIYVADTGSSVIRLVTRDGHVSTYAGTPFKAGNADGPRLSALFTHPTGLATDVSGNIFIADPASGIRKIDANGVVSTVRIAVEVDHPLSIAIHEDRHGETLFIADSLGIIRIQPSGETSRVRPKDVQGGASMGYPSAVTAVDDHSVIYADARTHTVRYLDFKNDYTRVLAGQAMETAAETSGGFRDGVGSGSLFDAPTGLLYRNGSVIVSDSGNKRIRRIDGLDLRSEIRVSERLIPSCSPAKNQLRVAYVGNSFTYWDTDWGSSIPGQIERSLHKTSEGHGLTATLDALQLIDASLSAAADYLELLASAHCYSTVIFSVNSVSLKGTPGVYSQDTWVKPATEIFRRIGRAYAQANVRLLIVVIPTHLEVGPAEGTWVKMLQGALTPTDPSNSWRLALRSAGVPYIDMWPIFVADLKSASHRALYGTVDTHLTPYGRALVASSVSAALKSLLGY